MDGNHTLTQPLLSRRSHDLHSDKGPLGNISDRLFGTRFHTEGAELQLPRKVPMRVEPKSYFGKPQAHEPDAHIGFVPLSMQSLAPCTLLATDMMLHMHLLPHRSSGAHIPFMDGHGSDHGWRVVSTCGLHKLRCEHRPGACSSTSCACEFACIRCLRRTWYHVPAKHASVVRSNARVRSPQSLVPEHLLRHARRVMMSV